MINCLGGERVVRVRRGLVKWMEVKCWRLSVSLVRIGGSCLGLSL
jgi:hypothetical protein